MVFSDGRTETFDLLAGFDGIRSSTGCISSARHSRRVRPATALGACKRRGRDDVRGMEFLQGIGSKTGAMPLGDELMYIFHIRPEARGRGFQARRTIRICSRRAWRSIGSYVAEVAASLDANSDIVYSPIEPMLLPWPWFRGRVVIGGDAAHTFPPHLTQGAAMAAEDGYVLAREMLADDVPIEARLMRYSQMRYARLRLRLHILVPMDAGRTIRPHADDLAAARLELATKRLGADRRQRPHPRQPRHLAIVPLRLLDAYRSSDV